MSGVVYQVGDGLRAHLAGAAHLVGGLAAELDDRHIVTLLQRLEELAEGGDHRLAVFVHRPRDVDGEDIVGTLTLEFLAELLHQLRVVGLQGVHTRLLGSKHQVSQEQDGE